MNDRDERYDDCSPTARDVRDSARYVRRTHVVVLYVKKALDHNRCALTNIMGRQGAKVYFTLACSSVYLNGNILYNLIILLLLSIRARCAFLNSTYVYRGRRIT